MSDEAEPFEQAHAALHLLWTKAVGTDMYAKDEWRRLEAAIYKLAGYPLPKTPPDRLKQHAERLSRMVSDALGLVRHCAEFSMVGTTRGNHAAVLAMEMERIIDPAYIQRLKEAG